MILHRLPSTKYILITSSQPLGAYQPSYISQKVAYIDELAQVAVLEVPEDRGVVEVREAGHVLAFLELGRVDLRHLPLLEGLLLK